MKTIAEQVAIIQKVLGPPKGTYILKGMSNTRALMLGWEFNPYREQWELFADSHDPRIVNTRNTVDYKTKRIKVLRALLF